MNNKLLWKRFLKNILLKQISDNRKIICKLNKRNELRLIIYLFFFIVYEKMSSNMSSSINNTLDENIFLECIEATSNSSNSAETNQMDLETPPTTPDPKKDDNKPG